MGRWLVVNHKHDDYASTALTLVNVTNTTRLLGGKEEKEILVYVYVKNTRKCVIIFFRVSSIYTVGKNRYVKIFL